MDDVLLQMRLDKIERTYAAFVEYANSEFDHYAREISSLKKKIRELEADGITQSQTTKPKP